MILEKNSALKIQVFRKISIWKKHNTKIIFFNDFFFQKADLVKNVRLSTKTF